MVKVFVTRKIPRLGLDLLKRKNYLVKVNPHNRLLTPQEIINIGRGAAGLLCLLTDKIDGQIMDGLGPQLKVIANYAVGFDNIDLEAAKSRKILVTNTPDVLAETVAEHAIGLVFALTRRIVEADKWTRRGKFRGWEPLLFLGSDIAGKTLGVVGLGRIGAAVAAKLKHGFGVKLVYYNRSRKTELEKQLGMTYLPLAMVLKTADFISLHLPLTPSTRHLIGTKELKMMKPSASLINTARGAIIDETALVAALKNHRIRGAALDVFEFEPRLTPGLTQLKNIVLTPHIASATQETRDKMAVIAAKNIIAVLSGHTPPQLVS